MAKALSTKVLSPKKSKATIFTVAELAGVSIATVSSIVNKTGKGRYTKDTQAKVLKICKQVGYKPSFIAQSLARRTNPAIGLLCGLLNDVNVTRGLDRAVALASDKGMHIVVATQATRDKWSNLLEEGRVNWIVSITYTLEELKRFIPHRFLDRVISIRTGRVVHESPVGMDISWDSSRSGILAMDHLAKLGHEEVAILAGKYANIDSCAVRLRTAYQRGRELGMKVAWIANPSEVDENIPSSGQVMAREVLEKHPKTTAVFCRQDYHALGAYHVFHQAGKRIPEDIAVVGCFDLQEILYFDPPLTSTTSPLVKGIEIAMGSITSHEPRGRNEYVDLTDHIDLIVRESTVGFGNPPGAANTLLV